jgi:hypothetical protein
MISALGFIFGGYRKVSPFFLPITNMKKVYLSLVAFIVLFAICTRDSCAQNTSESSASIKSASEAASFDYRVENLKKFLQKYNSPLAEYAEIFVNYADMNGLDYRLVPAITGVESTFGKHIPLNSYNAYGWANGDFSFASWEDSISHVSEVLKEKYIDKGVDTIPEIARTYAPPSSTWGGKVSYFVKKIDTLPLDFDII